MARYEIWLTTDAGEAIQLIDQFRWLNATRSANRIAPFSLGIPPQFNRDLIRVDRQIQVWRAPTGARLKLWRAYFIRRWGWETVGGEESFVLSGWCSNDLLRRRVVAAYSESSQASKTDLADDMMKEIVSESQSDANDPTPDAGTRDWDDFNVQADLGLGPSVQKAFSFKYLLKHSGAGVLPAIARAARENGTEVFFDVVPVPTRFGMTFEFRTYTDQIGRDVSDDAVFSPKRQNLIDPYYFVDHGEEINYVYGLGQGRKGSRTVEQVYDATRYGKSKWNRCEGIADARNAEDDAVEDAAYSALADGRPREYVGGTILSTRGTRFGADWDFGYRVGVKYHGEHTAVVTAVTISLDEEKEETIDATLGYRNDE